MLYLDYAASTPVYPEVVEEMKYWFEKGFANPSSNHAMGIESKEAIDEARELIADEIGCYPSEIIFTSGATESNNLAIKGYCLANRDKGNHIITTSIEHKCVLNICAYLETQGFEVTYLAVKPSGHVDPEEVKKAIKPETILCSIMTVNNELGTIQPIEEIGQICFKNNIKFHTDAAQAMGKIDLDIDDMNLDFLSISAHKFQGPKGIGALFIRDAKTAKITPVIHGAGQELGLRGGSLPTPLIVGMQKSLSLFKKEYLSAVKQGLFEKQFNESIKLLEQSSFALNGREPKLPNIHNITLNKLNFTRFINERQNQLCLSQGSACSSKEIKPSHVLRAIGLADEQANKSVRLSFTCKL